MLYIGIYLPTLRHPSLIPNNLSHRLHQTDPHNRTPKHRTTHRSTRLPTPGTQFDITKWRQDISQRTRTRRSDELKHRTQVAGYETERHGADDQGCGEDEMEVHVERLVFEPVIHHYFAADETF